jgi:hypothetical protein
VFHADYWPKPNQIKIQYFGQLRSVNNLWSYSHRNSPNQTPAKWDHLSRSIPRVWLAKEPHVTRSDYPTPIASSTATNPSWLSVENGFMSELTQSRDIWLVHDSTSHGPRKSTFFKVVKKHVFFADRRHKKHTICPNWKLFEASKSKIHFKMGHAVVIPVYLWVLNKWTRECWDLESPESPLFQSWSPDTYMCRQNDALWLQNGKIETFWNVEIQNAL